MESLRRKATFEHTLDAFGNLDVLVNNAAVFSFGPLESMREEEVHRQYNTNVLGLLVATSKAVKLFGAQVREDLETWRPTNINTAFYYLIGSFTCSRTAGSQPGGAEIGAATCGL